ncbi:hypothetical protein PIB30_065371 [Stylosanthes scabra]|uniref:Transmembrane protein n=1 Tax=Stylosanthes scabra TaxID=79078 RepID=A0ABU6XK75_9FABA|nr:hypothetical protein [Stylosanthes scabra]
MKSYTSFKAPVFPLPCKQVLSASPCLTLAGFSFSCFLSLCAARFSGCCSFGCALTVGGAALCFAAGFGYLVLDCNLYKLLHGFLVQPVLPSSRFGFVRENRVEFGAALVTTRGRWMRGAACVPFISGDEA